MSTAELTFSFIVPVYNVEQYLGQCIESVLGQTCPDFELILVDDGSTDSSGEICDRYKAQDPRIHVVHKQNAGVSVARNVGLDHAKGRYICFIDSDDWIECDYLEKIQAEIEDFDILFFGCVWHYEDGSERSLCPPAVEYRTNIGQGITLLLKNDMHVNYFGFTWNNVFRRDILAQHAIRFVEQLSVSEDEVFTLAYCNHASSLKVIPSPLYHYRWKEQGLTHRKKSPKEWRLLADSFLSLLDGIEDKELKYNYKKRIVGYYNAAAWAHTNPFGWIKWQWKMLHYCRKNNLPLPKKEILKGGLNKMKQIFKKCIS